MEKHPAEVPSTKKEIQKQSPKKKLLAEAFHDNKS
jgi:hypothetical protein